MSGSRPTRAAALAYRADRDRAPRVTASGKGRLAERIVDLARAAGVPVREDAALAEVLSRLDPGEEIPPETYRVVAEILAFLYRLDRDHLSPSGSRP
ncbi:MAG: EscU/YscU/HrcU family type III secretion system export apparatus switch protein [Deferrisomatales bacterium]